MALALDNASAIAHRLTLAQVIVLERIDRSDMRGVDAEDIRILRLERCLSEDDPPTITPLGVSVRRAARHIETEGAPTLL